MNVIGIDAATIIPGKGGTGGGIWTYAKNILLALDRLTENQSDVKLKVFVNETFDLDLNHIEVIRTDLNTATLLNRLRYIHFSLPSLCKKHKVNVLHKLATEVPFFYRGNLVVTVHDFMNDFYLDKGYYGNNIFRLLKSHYFKYIEGLAINKSKFIFTPSMAIKDELIQRYGNKNVIVTGLGNSVNEILKPHQNKEPLCFYCIAGYYPHKGHIRVIELLESLVSKYNLDIKLYFRGNQNDNKYFNSILNRIKQSSQRERIIIEEYKKQDSLSEIYSNTDLMILLTEYEGFGLPVIEAQAMGLPVICSDIPVLREVSGGYACLVELENADKAAEIVYNYLQNKEMINRNVKSGFINAGSFQWSKNAEQLLRAYKSVTENRPDSTHSITN